MIKTTIRSLQVARDEIDLYHKKWFEDACEIAKRVGAPVVSYRITMDLLHFCKLFQKESDKCYRDRAVVPFISAFLYYCWTMVKS